MAQKISTLHIGGLYFDLGYTPDDTLSQPLIDSLKYLGMNVYEAQKPADSPAYCFSILRSGDILELSERQLDSILDLEGLIDTLSAFLKKQKEQSK